MLYMRSILLLVVVLVLGGCNATDAADLKGDAGKLAESAARSAVNASVVAKVNTALSLRKGVHMEGLHIEGEAGTITVGGHVRTAAEKKLVLEIARETRGVEKLVDKLRVEP